MSYKYTLEQQITAFWSKVNIDPDNDKCWEWKLGDTDRSGKVSLGNKNTSANRMAWVITYGEIPNGLWVMRKCENNKCVNPRHLELQARKGFVKQPCPSCGKIFKTTLSRIERNGRKYCSRECGNIGRQDRVKLTCSFCGKGHETFPSQLTKSGLSFCSKECYKRSREKVNRTCAYCGKGFKTIPSNLKKKYGVYCGLECMRKAQFGPNHHSWRGGYSRYRGPNWNKQRNLARMRDGNKCQYCQKTRRENERRFQIHHIKPFREFNSDYLAANDLLNLITLCPQCHAKAELGKIPTPKRLL